MKLLKSSFSLSSFFLFFECIPKWLIIIFGFFCWFPGCAAAQLDIMIDLFLLVSSLCTSTYLALVARSEAQYISCCIGENAKTMYNIASCKKWIIPFIIHSILFSAYLVLNTIYYSLFSIIAMPDFSSFYYIIFLVMSIFFISAYAICIVLFYIAYMKNSKKYKLS